MSVESSSVCKDTNEVRDDGNLQTSHGRLSFNTETLLYVVLPYDYYYYVKTLTTYFMHLEFKIGFDLFLNLDLAKFLCIITPYQKIKHFELL